MKVLWLPIALAAALASSCGGPSNETCTIASVTYVYQEECYPVGKVEECQPVYTPIYVYDCTTPTPEHNPKAEVRP